MPASDVVRKWHDEIGANQFMGIVITATQGGPDGGGRGAGALYYQGALLRGSNGALSTQRGPVLFSDRRDQSRVPMQNFDGRQADDSEFTLLEEGALREHSFTWGFTQDIALEDVGNNTLAGWGGSIGNTGQPSYWVVAVDNTVSNVPG